MNKIKIVVGIVFLICIIIIIMLAGYIFYGIVYDKVYERAFNDGQVAIILQIQQGEIPVLTQQNNQTVLNWYDINNICGDRG